MKCIQDIEHVFCINLNSRPDRWLVINNKLRRLGIEVERVPAVDGSKILSKSYLKPEEIGIYQSQIKCFELAKERGYKNFLVLEDDVTFCKDFHKNFEESVSDLPPSWDMLYLGALFSVKDKSLVDHPVKIRGRIWRSVKSAGGHAIIFRDSVYEDILNKKDDYSVQIDIQYSFLHKDREAYIVVPNIAWQRKDWSNIQKEYVDCGRNGGYDYKNRIFT